LHRAIVNLAAWKSEVGQKAPHLWVFLASKEKGLNPDSAVEYRDSFDKDWWNRYMRLSGGEDPFFDPCAGERRKKDYPHNTAFKMRRDRWTNGSTPIIGHEGDDWKFEAEYVERLRSDSFKIGSTGAPIPEPDLIAWLYRREPFDDAATYETLRDKFRSEFNLTDDEVSGLFDEQSIDTEPEGAEFLAHRRTPEELLAEMAAQGDGFDMVEAAALIAEVSGPQPVDVDDVVELARSGRGQLILQGPPGTGKTHLARQAAAALLGADEPTVHAPSDLSAYLKQWQAPVDGDPDPEGPGVWDIVQFHPSYNYEDFVRGISSEIDADRPVFRAVDRTMGKLAKLAAKLAPKPVVLIVDEINRGDLAKVLGELIFALEYRGEAVRTPYAVDGNPLVAIPENLKVLATMNTADRSISIIDYAIRRRFDFVDLGASRDALEDFQIRAAQPLDVTERILALFDAVNAPLAGEPDFQVGHTYFMTTDAAAIGERFVFQVLPLLAEYRREGLIAETTRIKPEMWPSDRGIPLTPPRPFDLAETVATWLAPD
jgi:MoxR-like ATPase